MQRLPANSFLLLSLKKERPNLTIHYSAHNPDLRASQKLAEMPQEDDSSGQPHANKVRDGPAGTAPRLGDGHSPSATRGRRERHTSPRQTYVFWMES